MGSLWSKSTTTSTDASVQPYTMWNDPAKSWIDCLISWKLSYDLQSLVIIASSEDGSVEQRKALQTSRTVVLESTASLVPQEIKKWQQQEDCPIIEHLWHVPRQSDILQQWQIVDHVEDRAADPEIAVLVRFPAHLLKATVDYATEPMANGCHALVGDCDDLPSLLQPKVPWVLLFHGGGLTIGSPQMSATADYGRTLGAAVVASVTYRLAPEDPFPAAIIDALSVVDHCSKVPTISTNLHVAGVSAGANLASVVALECARRRHVQLQSAALFCPMLNPAMDAACTQLRFVNSTIAPVPWLRWSWQVYLQLEQTAAQRADVHSTQLAEAWKASRYAQSPSWRRLVHPTLDVPDCQSLSTQFLIQTNRADPLYQDGKDLADALEHHAARVTYLEHGGSHYLGTKVDPKADQAMGQLWRDMVVGTSS